jgi:hypothetical protein
VPLTATGQCPVPVLPRRAKTSFPGRGAAPLRFAAPSTWVQKGRCAGLRSASASAVPVPWGWCRPASWLCATATAATLPTSTRNRTGGRLRQHRQRVSGDLREKQKHRNSLRRPVAAVAALAPVCWLAPAPGASGPESALGVGPRLPQHESGDLDMRDSGGENEPTLWAAPILVLF